MLPSGTALQLAEDIMAHSTYNSWELNTRTNPQALPISAHREGDVPGIHEIHYTAVLQIKLVCAMRHFPVKVLP